MLRSNRRPHPCGDRVTAPQLSVPRVEPDRQFHPLESWRGRIAGPAMRMVVRPVLEHAPLTTFTLARLHLFDLLGMLLPLPRGATAQRRTFAEFDAELVTGAGVSASAPNIVLYFHGGGFVSCGLRTHRRLVARISSATSAPALQVNYRQLPAVSLADTLEDCVHVYRSLVGDGHRPHQIALAGDSAGGYLAFAVARRAIADGLPAPAAIAALSPWIDLSGRHNASHPNAKGDPYIPVRKFAQIATLLAPAGDPLLGLLDDDDLSGMPPTLIQVGSGEVLRSDAELMTERLANAGVECLLQLWDRQVHVFQAGADLLPEGGSAIEELGAFLRNRLTGK